MASTKEDYPTAALLPKKDTGIHNFLTKYPEYDGRGTIIAIFDSGVDPSAAGLQVTTEGKPKVIERFNCTGSGDVDMTTKVQPENLEIKGLTGRILKIPFNWKNPSGVYRIGMKMKYELLGKIKIEALRKSSRKKYTMAQKAVLAKSNAKLQKFNEENANKTFTLANEFEKRSIEAEVEVLNSLMKKYKGDSPVYDCVLFHDGDKWCAVVDTTEEGNLADCKVLVEFSKDPLSYDTFSSKDQITFSINVHNDGDVLEIVTCCSSHGTHVASIAGAYFPDCPDRNGIAPGAQIISLCIGDSRISTMETGTGLVRAAIRIMQNCRDGKKIHVINMSYGEMANWSDTGRISKFINEVIDKYGVVWVASAGNNGPALFTVGAPPDMSTTNIIGVGAYLSLELVKSEFSHPERLPANAFSWSSRGPTTDGTRGVSVMAPGGAVTSVPRFSLRGCQYCNGTSMASPHVTGAIAVLISGLLQRGIKYTPYSIKRILENTALFMDDVDLFAQGHGLLQIEKAFDYLLSYHSEMESVVRFQITSSNGHKGILHRVDDEKEYSISVQPVFFDDENIDPAVKIDFRLSLVITSSAPWVSATQYLEMYNSKRNVIVKVDPTNLTEGVHYAIVKAFDVKNPGKGAIFSIDVTAFKPIIPTISRKMITYSRQDVRMSPGVVKRYFIDVPDTSYYAGIHFDTPHINKSVKYVLHAVQILPMKSCTEISAHKYFEIVDGKIESPLYFKVKPGYTLEIAIAQCTAAPSSVSLNFIVTFGASCPLQSDLIMHHGQGIYQIDIKSATKMQSYNPAIQLKQAVSYLKPVESTISVLTDERDIVPPDMNIYQLVLTYNFNILKTVDVTMKNPVLSCLLYESDYESQMWMLFDSNKRYVATGDAFPNHYTVKLDKGSYVIRHQIRHDNKELLDRLSDLIFVLDQKLVTPITLEVYPSYSQAVLSVKADYAHCFHPKIVPFYVAPLPVEKLPKFQFTTGQHLSGTFTFRKGEDSKKKMDQYDFTYVLTDVTKKSNNSVLVAKNTKSEDFDEAHREFLKQWLQKIDSADKNAEIVFNLLKEKFPYNPTIYASKLQNLEPDGKRVLPGVEISSLDKSALKDIIYIANEGLNLINTDEILKCTALKTNTDIADISKLKSVMEQEKTTLVEILSRKGCALCQLYVLQQGSYTTDSESQKDPDDESAAVEIVSLRDIESVWQIMVQHADPMDNKNTLYFTAWCATAFRHYGTVAKALLKMAEDKPTYEIDKSLLWTFSTLNWDFLRDYYALRLIVNYPKNYPSF